MKNRIQGFTLIELLVVISIISLISSIVLSALSEARIKGRNAERTQSMQEYLKAINLSYDKYGEYPDPGNTTTTCITDVTDNDASANRCGMDNVTLENATLYTQILEFRPGAKMFPTISAFYSWGTAYTYEGPLYRCFPRTGGVCSRVVIFWMLEGVVSDCGFGATEAFPGTQPNITSCSLIIQ